MKDYQHTTDKLQTFRDSKYNFTGSLRIDVYADLPFVLTLRYPTGKLFHREGFRTAYEAKLFLDRIVYPGTRNQHFVWWTIRGYVHDIA